MVYVGVSKRRTADTCWWSVCQRSAKLLWGVLEERPCGGASQQWRQFRQRLPGGNQDILCIHCDMKQNSSSILRTTHARFGVILKLFWNKNISREFLHTTSQLPGRAVERVIAKLSRPILVGRVAWSVCQLNRFSHAAIPSLNGNFLTSSTAYSNLTEADRMPP